MFKRCTKCLYPSTKPDLHFNEDGVCSACTSVEARKTINWEQRMDEFLALLKANDMECIVPSSGGKDSTYQVLRLKELGARVVVVTATTCDLSAQGRANIDNLSRYASTVEVTPNRTLRAKLNRLSMQLVGDPSWPEHVTIHRTPFTMAAAMGIGLIIYGECSPSVYGGPPGSAETRRMTQRWASEWGGFLGLRAADFVGMSAPPSVEHYANRRETNAPITEDDMRSYSAPTDAELDEAGVQAYFLGQFEEWDSRRNAARAAQHGFRYQRPCEASWWAFENQDNLQVALHDHLMFLKYGYGRACAQMSVDVRRIGDGHSQQWYRPEMLRELKAIDGKFPLTYMEVPLETILGRMGVSTVEYIDICNRFLNRDIFAEDVCWGERPKFKDEAAAWA